MKSLQDQRQILRPTYEMRKKRYWAGGREKSRGGTRRLRSFGGIPFVVILAKAWVGKVPRRHSKKK
jgi:hypothetical protein